ncbi:MAG TPA: hypothetical protein VN654_21430 [Vicinamibacterales bacterium]|jgi:hypothetical protein|nr:hypothetical protein [Vicinamibacterales bacterium]
MRLFLAALTLVMVTTPATAQWLDRKTPGIPRQADGKPNLTAPAPRGPDGKPDLSGVWNAPAPAARPDLSDLQPWVRELAAQRQQEYHKTRPFYQCLPSGPEAEKFGGWRRIIQTPAAIAILSDDLTYRVIHMDGRTLEDDAAPSWMGYSVGRWEGDTLVVDSNGFNDKTWTSRYGVSHTEKLRTTERYRRTDFGHVQVEVTYTDPGAYTKPWSFKATMALAADTEMLESVCERSSEHWEGSLSEASKGSVTVPPDVMARYVGVYSGKYGGRTRTIEVSLSGGQLVAKIEGGADIEGGLGAAGLDTEGARPLIPRSLTYFEGLGLGYEFIVNDKNVATDLVEIHISGPYKFSRQK